MHQLLFLWLNFTASRFLMNLSEDSVTIKTVDIMASIKLMLLGKLVSVTYYSRTYCYFHFTVYSGYNKVEYNKNDSWQ
jgi:hypothetical protein